MINSLISTEKKIALQRAFLGNETLYFEHSNGFEQAVKDGFFLLKRPAFIDLTPGLRLASSFYKDADHNDPYTGFKLKEGIYYDREHFQTEHILLDQYARKDILPFELNQLCDQMNYIGILILKNICKWLMIDSKDWNHVTCGVLQNEGTHWFACSHYRSDLRRPGCAAHKDTGYVTVLHIDEDGLEAFIDDVWVHIEPVPGYFVINFGASLEILTQNLKTPIKAIFHRVREMKPKANGQERYSFAAFLNPPTHLNLYQYSVKGMPEAYMLVKDFLEGFNKSTWYDKHEQFGIHQA